MTPIPTIRDSAKARLLLYKLIREKLKYNQRRILDENPIMWQQILELLEKGFDVEKTDYVLLQKLETIFFAIDTQTTKGLERQLKHLGAGGSIMRIKPTKLLDSFIKDHLTLIKSVQREQLEKIGLCIERGIREGLLQKDIEKEICRMTDVCKKRAQRIARAAPLQYSGALTRHRQMSAGIKKYRWQTSRDERVRDSHTDRNNKTYSWENSVPHPRSEVNCRCDAVPVLSVL